MYTSILSALPRHFLLGVSWVRYRVSIFGAINLSGVRIRDVGKSMVLSSLARDPRQRIAKQYPNLNPTYS